MSPIVQFVPQTENSNTELGKKKKKKEREKKKKAPLNHSAQTEGMGGFLCFIPIGTCCISELWGYCSELNVGAKNSKNVDVSQQDHGLAVKCTSQLRRQYCHILIL
jgi:hypothetical protein